MSLPGLQNKTVGCFDRASGVSGMSPLHGGKLKQLRANNVSQQQSDIALTYILISYPYQLKHLCNMFSAEKTY